MPYSRFTSADLDSSKNLVVKGPIGVAPDEAQLELRVLTFAIVQGDRVVYGEGKADGAGDWLGTVDGPLSLKVGEPAEGTGCAFFTREAQPASAGKPARPPLVQTLSWSERVNITGGP